MEKLLKDQVVVQPAPKEEPKHIDGFVKAIRTGYDGIKVREKGDVFHFEGPKGSWMEEVDEKGESKEPKAPALKAKHK